jgi:ubiquitin-protein ligase
MSAGAPPSKRLARELATVQSEEMRKSGIYYWFDEANMRYGRAMILGPEGTPYAYCPLVFEVQFPADYPHSSPAVKILSSDGVTRFHPNLYVQGKVCLSILGTWTGPKWSAVMTISTVLSSIQSLLEANPIVNEPGYEKLKPEESRAKAYAEFVQARLVELSVGDLLKWKAGATPPAWAEFQEELDAIAPTLLSKLKGIVQEKALDGEKTYPSIFYSMRGFTRWNDLLKRLEEAEVGKIAGGEGL